MNARASLVELKQQRPEWEPWLRVVEVALREAESPTWRDMVPADAPATSAAPRLGGATLVLQRRTVESYMDRLLATASKSGTREMASLSGASARNVDAFAVFRAALCHEGDGIAHAAARCSADDDALLAVTALLPVPLLQACNRTWGPVRDWVEPYCPTCGSWPALAEIRGIERSRYHRCGPCGSEWHAHGLSCPFCGTTDHEDLVRLVPGNPGASSSVECCRKCLGYLKSFNTLQGCAPSAVLLQDLGGVALDLAAIDHGYSRPATAGYALQVMISESPARRRRFLSWNA